MSFLKKLGPANFYAATLNIVFLFVMIALLFSTKSFPPKVPLWFSLSWGEIRLAKPESLWLLPALAFGFFIGGSLFGKFLKQSHKTLALVVVWSTCFLSLVFLLSLYKILLLLK